MLWINEHKNVWRVAVLVLLLVAIMGPWFFDVIYAPGESQCSAPFIWLKEDFCGKPLPGITFFAFMAGAFINISFELVTGAIVLTDRAREFVFSLSVFLFVLPLFSTLLLIRGEGSRRRQVFHVAAWGLAALSALPLAIYHFSRAHWALWGIWLYIGLAASALILEVLALVAGRKPSQG
jgi:hypothetical protein